MMCDNGTGEVDPAANQAHRTKIRHGLEEEGAGADQRTEV